MNGILVLDKPAGMSSASAVDAVKKRLGAARAGHGGTLDPLATGVLPICLDEATKLAQYLLADDKAYEAELLLGVETTTLDASGEVVATHDQSAVTLADVQRVAAERFTGLIMQIPPMVSAVKVGGRRLHELAREGIEVEREPRPVTIYELTISDGPDDTFGIQVHCSSGTYVRSLVADIGTALGGGAHLATLRRTAVGAFGIDEAVPLETLSPDAVLPLPEVARTMAHLTVDDERGVLVRHGRRMERGELGVDDASAGPWAVLDEAGSLLAVYEDHGAGTVKPAVVLVPA